MALPNFSQIVQSMITFLQGKRPSLNTNVGTVANDVVISTVANQLSAQDGISPSVYSSIAYTQDLQAFVTDAALLVPSDLDQIGNNYGMIRLSGTQATGTITFQIRNYTISSPIVNVPAGTIVSTLATTSSPSVSFATSAGITFSPSLAPSYFNPLTGLYEQSTTIVCQTIGQVGNVGASTITSLVSSVSGINSIVNNTATTGGTDIESNTAFASRIQIKLEGNNIGTPNGIISLVETNPAVQQAIVVGPNDPEMQRNQFGGSVDVYIKGQILTSVTDTQLYSTMGPQFFILNHQPALSVFSVTGIVSSNPYTFVSGTDYQFVENPNSLFGGSTEAASYINFAVQTFFNITFVDSVTELTVNSTSGMQVGDQIHQGTFTTTITAVDNPIVNHIQVGNTAGFGLGAATFTGFKPDNNTIITITYAYDSLIETLQAVFNSDSDHIVASDILIREAIQALINVSASIIVLPGNIPASVVSNVQTNLTTFINNLGLGAIIDLSDLVVVIEGTPGVDQVDLTTLSMQSIEGLTTVTVPPGQRISVGKNAYTVANVLAISVE